MNHHLLFTETLATANNSPTETLPVQFDTGVEVDPNLNNFTRSDANCDKTGTCYDGKRSLNCFHYLYTICCTANKIAHSVVACKAKNSMKLLRFVNAFLPKITNIFSFSFLFLRLVAVHCKDTRIAVQVRTNKPFNGRIYALGRSETCNIDVLNSDAFRLDLTMGGQDCNTQSVVSNLRQLERVCTYLFLNLSNSNALFDRN